MEYDPDECSIDSIPISLDLSQSLGQSTPKNTKKKTSRQLTIKDILHLLDKCNEK